MREIRPVQSGSRRFSRRVVVAVALMCMVALLVVALRGQAVAESPADGTLRINNIRKFNHQKHVAAGTPCVFCHPGALNGPVATLPSLAKCVGCHQNVEVSGDEGERNVAILMNHWEEGAPLRWEKTHDQPDFVYFTHQPHIAAGVNCENCHGDVS